MLCPGDMHVRPITVGFRVLMNRDLPLSRVICHDDSVVPQQVWSMPGDVVTGPQG